MNRILVIDDDTELCELLSDYLGGEGFLVETVNHGTEGATQALEQEYTLVVLDVMLPGMSGFDVLRRIRETSKVPVIMLTARGDDVDRIVGLELGADDYLPKPFNPRELIARIRAVQRRMDTSDSGTRKSDDGELRVGDIVLCPTNRSVKRDGTTVELTSVEFTLLTVLLKQAGNVISREELVEKALGRRLSAYDRSIDVHVSALRKKLGKEYAGEERIKTIRGIGYLYTRAEA
ncbi:two component transcriptional regulator, winged helix family [Malonomonas rubra DSM 5091]|uniref:Two component transcriptional regulator, winged helix family n=1 Tax=Malonomonas rubra DSM 5091 TaxID=1122189 RepID=A0A1M6IQB8_MALRU|nr:response regulator transcription factor [Malonomonas rubra]SHJ36650.1 two component transcriptional regulator, winged helix family [Malonomonas rubra DSM 5091]